MYLEFNFRSGLFNALTPTQAACLGLPSDLGSNNGIKQNVLRFLFKRGLFYEKNANLTNLYVTPFRPVYGGRGCQHLRET